MNAGHAHADALAVTLSAGAAPTADRSGHRHLHDGSRRCGTGCARAQLHNTVTVDGRSQSVPAGPFHWTRAAGARRRARGGRRTRSICSTRTTDAYAPRAPRAHGVRDRCARLDCGRPPRRAGPPSRVGALAHRSRSGPSRQTAAAAWALHASRGSRGAPGDRRTRRWTSFRGDSATGLGWVAPIYGRLTPATTLRGDVGADRAVLDGHDDRRGHSARARRGHTACSTCCRATPAVGVRRADAARAARRGHAASARAANATP